MVLSTSRETGAPAANIRQIRPGRRRRRNGGGGEPISDDLGTRPGMQVREVAVGDDEPRGGPLERPNDQHVTGGGGQPRDLEPERNVMGGKAERLAPGSAEL